MYITGGLRDLFKCAYYFVNFKFDEDSEHTIMSLDENKYQLRVHMIDADRLVDIDQLDPDKIWAAI